MIPYMRSKIRDDSIFSLRQHPPSDLITVYYLFYDADNPRICRKYPVRMINSMADVEAL